MKPRHLTPHRHSSLPFPRVGRASGLPLRASRSNVAPHPLAFRPYQQDAFDNRTNGVELWLWGRQTGKSFTLAAWAIDRLITRPGRLVTILSNSLANGAELNQKCAEIARLYENALRRPRPSVECGDASPLSSARHDAPSLQRQLKEPQRRSGSSQAAVQTSSSMLNEIPPLNSPLEPLTSPVHFECMNYEIRVTMGGRASRIKILPANPRTARGFSGDLILDEFAFHENSAAIWEAAEPILSANHDYLCRIASTPNGRHNMFYRLVTDPSIFVRRVPRSEAYRQGLQIYHPTTRQPITPDEARALAHDKRAYDQNYECIFESENMALLSHELISAAEDPSVGLICDDQWSPSALVLLDPNHNPTPNHFEGGAGVPPAVSSVPLDPSPRISHLDPHSSPVLPCTFDSRIRELEPDPLECAGTTALSPAGHVPPVEFGSEAGHVPPPFPGPSAQTPRQTCALLPRNFYVGVDVGRSRDLTVISVLEKHGDMFHVRAILRLRNLRLPAQQNLLEVACRSPRFAGAQIDMTGLGLGLYEYTHKKFGDRIRGLNFASNLPVGTDFPIRNSNYPNSAIRSARAPEVLALRLLQTYESRRIRHPIDPLLREDLHKPERITSPEGRVSIAAARTETGHADHFWSLALAVDAALRRPEPYIHVVEGIRPRRIPRDRLIM